MIPATTEILWPFSGKTITAYWTHLPPIRNWQQPLNAFSKGEIACQSDKAIEFIQDAHVNAPDKPFFLYYATGAGHAPHHVPAEWADKYKGKFDMGWDEYRKIVHQRQLDMGIIPPGTELSAHDPDVLVSLGMTCLGIEQVQALCQQAAARGEGVESEVQRQFDTLQRQLAEGTTAQVSTRLAALLNKAPGVSVVYRAKPAAPASQEDKPGDGATEQHDG